MSWLVCAGGAVLAIAGLVSILSGAPYLRLEFGWTEVIAGATAVSGGVVTMALGAILHRLQALQGVLTGRAQTGGAEPARRGGSGRSPEDVASERDARAEPASWAEPAVAAAGDPDPPPVAPEPAYRSEPSPPRPTLLARLGPRRTAPPVVPSSPTPADAVETAVAPLVEERPASASVVHTLVAPSPPDAPERNGTVFHRVGIEDVAESRDGVETQEPAESEVVGRYEAGGASYALFSNGTIEVTTVNGKRRFASMEELRAYVESQDKATVDPGS